MTGPSAGPATPRVLVVVATAAEAAHVPAGYDVLVTGMGKTAAACAVAGRLGGCAASPNSLDGLTVVNLGTAGALHARHVGLFEPGVVLNHDLSADAIRALGDDPRERLVVGESPITLATGDVFVTDPVVRDRLAARADLVDMEGYAVAYVAAAFGVPLRILKHVSDTADESALAWNDVVDHSARALAGALVAACPLD
ncbi:nucleosidase [Nocardioides sambongensis]|uniref:nucleosidase n=1 Tax=Nocardioides sambongensis TaxID=2589074 RepID=UPI001125C89B|nr:nucleosidase [Nocardioides sambongensis]